MIEFFNNTPLDELEVYAYIIAFGSYLLSILAAHSFGYGSTSRKKMYELPCFLTRIMFLIFNEKKINLWAIVMWVYSIIAIMSVLFIKFFDVYNCRFVYGCVIVSFFIILVSICIDFVFLDNKDN